MKMDKQLGRDFLSGLTEGAVGRGQAQLSQSLKDFVERILEREFVPSKY
jgi:hypothetical protein